MATVYIETSIVSHAAARPSSDANVAMLQTQARDWWWIERPKFDLVTSQLVSTMTKNPFLDELRETRERFLAEPGGTLAGLVAQLQRDERRSDREFVRPRSRSNQSSGPAKATHFGSESR